MDHTSAERLRAALRRVSTEAVSLETPEHEVDSAVSPKQRGARWAFGIAGSLSALFGICLWISTAFATNDLDTQLRLSRAEGIPTSIQDLIPPPVPESQNAAPLLDRCFELTGRLSKRDIDETSTRSPWPFPIATRKVIDQCRSLLRQAKTKPYCRFDSALLQLGAEADLNRKKHQFLTLLNCSANWRYYSGDVDGALSDWTLMASTIRTVTESGKLSFVGESAYYPWRQLEVKMMKLAVENGDDRETLKGVQRVLSSLGPFPEQRAQVGDQVVVNLGAIRNHLHASKWVGQDDDCTDASSCQGQDPISVLARTSLVTRRLEARQLALDRIFYRTLPRDPEDVMGLRRASKAADEWDSNRSGLIESAFDYLVRVPGDPHAAGTNIAELRVLQTATKLLLQGKPFPTRLPDWGGMTTDPYTNQPLRYGRTLKGFVVYSVGWNLIDDGGEHEHGGDDVAFTYPYIPKPKAPPPAPVHHPRYPVDDSDD